MLHQLTSFCPGFVYHVWGCVPTCYTDRNVFLNWSQSFQTLLLPNQINLHDIWIPFSHFKKCSQQLWPSSSLENHSLCSFLRINFSLTEVLSSCCTIWPHLPIRAFSTTSEVTSVEVMNSYEHHPWLLESNSSKMLFILMHWSLFMSHKCSFFLHFPALLRVKCRALFIIGMLSIFELYPKLQGSYLQHLVLNLGLERWLNG